MALVSRMNSDIEIVQSSLSTSFSELIRSLLFIIVVLNILFSISAKLTGITLGGVFVIFVAGAIFACSMSVLGRKT